jgi:hypothetical protein
METDNWAGQNSYGVVVLEQGGGGGGKVGSCSYHNLSF